MPSLLEALELKYGGSTTDCSLTDEEAESGSPKASSSALSISIFIPKKSPRHTVPALLVLQDCDISCAGNDDDKLRTKCRNVEELDLAQNKLSRWDEVFGILRHMPKIKFVNLSFNSLADTLMLKDDDCYKSLRNLVLNGTRVTWSTVQDLARILENLEELHLSLNEYRTVELDHTKPEVRNASLKKLHLTGNPIETWQEISKLGYVFPHLESLVLAECPIRSLACPEENLNHEDHHHQQQRHHHHHHRHQHHHHHHHHHHHRHQYQKHHRDARKRSNSLPRQQDENENPNGENSSSRLTKPENGVVVNDEEQQHGAVEERDDKSYNRTESECESSANKIPSSHDPFRMLRFLNVNGTLLSTWDDVERLARFPALKSLRMQGCPLFESPREYTEHERRQLLIARLPNVETLNGGGLISSQEREDAERAFIRYYMDKPEADRPERYSELVGIHGKLDPLVHVDLTPEKRVKVTFTYGDLVEVRSVDVYRTVFELKTKLESMVKIPANRMRLFYVDQVMKAQYGPEEMLYPNKQLYRYNIRNGDEIIIDSKLNRLVSTSSSSSSIRS